MHRASSRSTEPRVTREGATLRIRASDEDVEVDLTPYLHMRLFRVEPHVVDGKTVPLATTYHNTFEGVVATFNPQTCTFSYDAVYDAKRLSTHATAREAAIARAQHSLARSERRRACKRAREPPQAASRETDDVDVAFSHEVTREQRDAIGRANAIDLD